MKIHKISKHLVHEGGTKEYRIVYLSNKDTGHSLIIKRWGKVKTWGQVKVEKYSSPISANSEYTKISREKDRKGYHPKRAENDDILDDSTFQKNMSLYIPKMGADNITHLLGDDHDINLSGVRDPESVEFEEGKDGKFYPKSNPKVLKIDKAAEEAAKYSSNETWGQF